MSGQEAEGVTIDEVDALARRSAALERIAEILRHPVYGVGMLEDIAAIVEGVGIDLTNAEGRRTWWSH